MAKSEEYASVINLHYDNVCVCESEKVRVRERVRERRNPDLLLSNLS